MDDDENIVKVNFKNKRPKAKPGPNFFQTKTAGMIVVGALIALGLALHLFLTAP